MLSATSGDFGVSEQAAKTPIAEKIRPSQTSFFKFILDLLLRTVREIANQVYGDGVRALCYVQAGLNGRNAPSGLHSTGLGDLRYLRQAVANWSNLNALA
jgi:hypothetical protein